LLVAGKYQLLKQIGEGGFSMVYLASHVGLERNASRVVKLLKPELFDVPGVDRRFYREVQLTSELSQENNHIVRIYDDFGKIDQLGYYYVMEHLEGKVLSEYVEDERRLPEVDWCLDVIQQVCQGMQVAHEAGVIHRDLKPDNLFLVKRRKKENFVKILDFGIAGLHESAPGKESRFTQGPIGTPYYMSPEQGMNQPPDARSDLYSIGIILYELLTGHIPFVPKGKEHLVSALEVMASKMMSDPVAPDQMRRDRGISPELSALVMRLLAKNPDERIQTIEDLQEQLAACRRVAAGPELNETGPVVVASATEGYLKPYADLSTDSKPPQPTVGWVPTPEEMPQPHHPTPATIQPTGWDLQQPNAGSLQQETPVSPLYQPSGVQPFVSSNPFEPLPPAPEYTASFGEEEATQIQSLQDLGYSEGVGFEKTTDDVHAGMVHELLAQHANAGAVDPYDALLNSPPAHGSLLSEHDSQVTQETTPAPSDKPAAPSRVPLFVGIFLLLVLVGAAIVLIPKFLNKNSHSTDGGVVVVVPRRNVTRTIPDRRPLKPVARPDKRPVVRRQQRPVRRVQVAPRLRRKVPLVRRRVRARPARIRRRKTVRCAAGWKYIRVLPSRGIRVKLELEPASAQKKRAGRGWCISNQTQILEVEAGGFRSCTFQFSALKKRQTLVLKKRGQGLSTSGYCLSP
jgi:serine/threonine protein kinase